MYARPIPTARAPIASALYTSVPRRNPPSTKTGTAEPTLSTTSGRISMVARPVSVASATLTAVWPVWGMAACVPWIARLPSWSGIEAFAASFQAGAYLAWAIPCLLLALTFPVLMLAIHALVGPERRFLSSLGVLFGALYGGILGAVYWVMVMVVPARLSSGDLTGLTPLIVVSPHSVTNSLEYLGYALMGIATVFAGLAFPTGRRTSWIRGLFVVDGLAGISGAVFVLAGLLPAGMIALVVWAIALPAACLLLDVELLRPSSSAVGSGKEQALARSPAKAG